MPKKYQNGDVVGPNNMDLNLLRICYCIPLKNIPKIINAYSAFMVKERA